MELCVMEASQIIMYLIIPLSFTTNLEGVRHLITRITIEMINYLRTTSVQRPYIASRELFPALRNRFAEFVQNCNEPEKN
ncbi:unnamed protein product [Auanema sp. JU1783]|nr:unnamed protein product [Auanema sp. JU1783]